MSPDSKPSAKISVRRAQAARPEMSKPESPIGVAAPIAVSIRTRNWPLVVAVPVSPPVSTLAAPGKVGPLAQPAGRIEERPVEAPANLEE